MNEYEAKKMLEILKPFIAKEVKSQLSNVVYRVPATVISAENEIKYATVILPAMPNRTDQEMYLMNCSGSDLRVGDNVWVEYVYSMDNAYIAIKNDGMPWGGSNIITTSTTDDSNMIKYHSLAELGLTTDNTILDIYQAMPNMSIYSGWHGAATNSGTTLGEEMPANDGELTIKKFYGIYAEVSYRAYVNNTSTKLYRCVCMGVNGAYSRSGWNEPYSASFTKNSSLSYGSPFSITYMLYIYPHNGMVHFSVTELGTFTTRRGTLIQLGTLDSVAIPNYTQKFFITSQASSSNNTTNHYGMIEIHGKDSDSPGAVKYAPFESTGLSKSITFDIWYII